MDTAKNFAIEFSKDGIKMKTKQFIVRLSFALLCTSLFLISQVANAAEAPKSPTSEILSYFNDTVHIDLQGRVKVKDSNYVQVPFTKQEKAIIQSESETDIKALLLGKKELASHHDEIADLEPADALLNDIMIDLEDEYHDPVIQEEKRKQTEAKRQSEEAKRRGQKAEKEGLDALKKAVQRILKQE